MVTINAEHTLDYFAATNAVAISPEEILITVEELEGIRLETAFYVEECIEILASPPSNWPIA